LGGAGSGLGRIGIELFAGVCGITNAFKALGLAVLPPVELSLGFDVMSSLVEQCIAEHILGWIWSAPPCCSFSPLRNLDGGGPSVLRDNRKEMLLTQP
jgi:hypothetical protein